MEAEIWLDVEKADPNDLPLIAERFKQWFNEGAEARYGKPRYEYLAELDKPFHYQVDFGQADFTRAIQTLHGRLHRYGVKVFVHFLH